MLHLLELLHLCFDIVRCHFILIELSESQKRLLAEMRLLLIFRRLTQLRLQQNEMHYG
jgi:hypothetical protein